MTGQIAWADRPADAMAERWFRDRVRPADLGRWAAAWSMVAEQVRLDLPNEAVDDGEDVAAETAASIVARLRDAMRAGQPVVGLVDRDDRGPALLAPHEWARSVLLAGVAAEDKRVMAFRREHFGGGVMADDAEAEAWCDANRRPVSSARRVLRWRGLDGALRVKETGGSGPVERLRRLAEALAERYRWDAGSAVSFLFYGGVPDAPMLETSSSVGMAAWEVSITLAVHPDVPADVVADTYRRKQRQLMGAGRPRLLTEPVAEAVVAATLPGSWASRWQTHCEHFDGYSSVEDFRRAVQRARAKLLGGRADVAGRMVRALGSTAEDG